MPEGRRGGAVKSFFSFVAGLLALSVLAVGVGGYFAWREATRPGPLTEDAVVLFEPGASTPEMARQLLAAGAIRYPVLFQATARLRGDAHKLKAGEYKIPAGSSVVRIIDLLVEGKSILHYLTAPEGRTTAQILKLVVADEALTGELTLAPAEGELLPETYAFTRGETRDELVRDMMKAQDALIDRLWQERAMDLPFTTPEEAIVLASIVEKETGVAAERPLIAAVFINRLKKRMRLQSDPTIIYGITGGEKLGRGLKASEIAAATPYNTYVIYGLPPTPIANPGRAAIEAVLNPAESDALYFVADGSGGHVFSATLDEHNRNVAQWRRIERAGREEG
ncbi:MAG: aminodeoxychorismate lyase [Alphaproteobacteria bacterium RIFCSPHIGHO2_12_FULL_63_12]|nr:MAG: aminodeoxychorismate lyase [Alphaproteobacteria bacterium RIFCSPHIGHO2_12_FULL_63_12]